LMLLGQQGTCPSNIKNDSISSFDLIANKQVKTYQLI